MVSVPLRYLPYGLSRKNKVTQKKMLLKSRRFYKEHKYYNREKLASYHSRKSKHVKKAMKMYDIDNIVPNRELAKKTGCSLSALNKIVQKGEGAYYSSGSRPNQTAQSWGLARLASAITSGKSAAVDYNILDEGCDHRKKAFTLAEKAKQKYGYGHSRTRKIRI